MLRHPIICIRCGQQEHLGKPWHGDGEPDLPAGWVAVDVLKGHTICPACCALPSTTPEGAVICEFDEVTSC